MKNPGKRPIDHQMFVDKDGLKDGVEIETTKPETQVKSWRTKRMLPEKKRSAKWY